MPCASHGSGLTIPNLLPVVPYTTNNLDFLKECNITAVFCICSEGFVRLSVLQKLLDERVRDVPLSLQQLVNVQEHIKVIAVNSLMEEEREDILAQCRRSS